MDSQGAGEAALAARCTVTRAWGRENCERQEARVGIGVFVMVLTPKKRRECGRKRG